ncbi:MAG: dihydropteroate synthase [Gracilibacter sp. BRH_c7a]|nr:MAG: dihydropteroate synthase [Gracilibacter sp. BRH_c7a]
MPYNMRWLKIENLQQAEKALIQIGVDTAGINYMKGKAITRVIKLDKVRLAAAHILKQEMLSLGGDAAVHREVVVNGISETDVLLMGNEKQLKRLALKLRAQPFGLKGVAEALNQLLPKVNNSPSLNLDCRGKILELGSKTMIMGILNVTPDSFSDGGMFLNHEYALEQTESMVTQGADLIDIGGESTRPGYVSISAEEEWERLKPIITELVKGCPVPISVDTQKAEVAEKALEAGVHMINDIWGLQKDPKMAKIIGQYKAPIVIMHNKNNTNYDNLMREIIEFLSQSIDIALDNGISQNQIIIDPGIGFGKTPEQNMEVLSRLEELKILGFPILLGVSRKSVIGRTLDIPVEQRLEPTIALGTLGIVAGVDILRVHDVLENKKAALMVDQIIRRKRGVDYEGK